ncbi:MAG: deoxyribodipyrimidine photo-lyase [Rhodospirillaceae bacterium]|nr:deoxyribodipyrimidine photo-lyase [Rhodospirillaceae bacterium]MBT5944180.1 deoxyribodipyrimidine photo-lyase [Rhodospirillaceae bacterium]MBT6405868.1 deoxyribodipyrimidine photo-lyase [Rhodospirillaceae bacterium]MBT6536538.1 deoxyribodipyrimidine photo-lyase [Rhodospirillaceae bacterium]MBT7361223.1 deoxyribodipyrimidine photo-lyase [Rhodospirillaceae bacterium]
MSCESPAIVWFRQDLRLADNPALAAAIATGRPILPLYVLDEVSPDIRPHGGASRWWLHQSLESLAANLRNHGLRLVLRKGAALDVLRELVEETGAAQVMWNRCYEPAAIARDTSVKAMLHDAGVDAESFNGSLLIEPWQIETGQGGPYKVFTPFWKRLRELYQSPQTDDLPDTLSAADEVAGDELAAWALLPTAPDWAGGLRESWQVGEGAVRTRLAAFLENAVADYPGDRDRPDRAGTSRLSPHLHWGEISPHQVWRAATACMEAGGAAATGAEALLREVAWRDFNHHLLFHFPTIATSNWREQFDRFPWRDDPGGLAAWQRGQTGYPLVDAGLRELWHTGFMHNRVRMIVGSFLIKDLMIDWRDGEAWFWDTLVDADMANNAGNWQWVAGSGADASPFFRIFNPVTQGEKFDPAGDYVRRWVPELTGMPQKWVHKPWSAPAEILAESGVVLDQTYPAPIVDHGMARNRALDAYKALRNEIT